VRGCLVEQDRALRVYDGFVRFAPRQGRFRRSKKKCYVVGRARESIVVDPGGLIVMPLFPAPQAVLPVRIRTRV
jgi:hypothetical protein